MGEIVTEAKLDKPGRPEVSIPEDTLKLYLNYGFPKRVVAHPNQPKVSPRPKVQVTSVTPTNSNCHPISSSQHARPKVLSIKPPRPSFEKCCQSNCPSSFANRHNQSKTNTPKSLLPTPIKITNAMKPTTAPQNIQTHFVQYLTQ